MPSLKLLMKHSPRSSHSMSSPDTISSRAAALRMVSPGTGQGGQASSDVDARAVEIDSVGPGIADIDAGTHHQLFVLRQTDVHVRQMPVQRCSGADRIGDIAESRHKPVAQTLDHLTAVPRKDVDANLPRAIGPSLDSSRLMPTHHQDRVHQIHHENRDAARLAERKVGQGLAPGRQLLRRTCNFFFSGTHVDIPEGHKPAPVL